ncbi:LacI family DNA-binding transcriptional regulator [Cohnella zeiphila]|uniref:LacI family DNA-binding transcriptional regulator n=1 Tax=Cohnella zeiphila TaxID=2761120 RepID=A0A7X0SG59_9BACL|nr:LacI family DNA-binding transcriptional regulator [Cohnella zeiphila]MBB6729364.1 LacI family DNA-binding transcriptional regulator [Cohnella zeiphila]
MPVTKKDIAEYVGVSRSAVSLVLNNTPSSTIAEKTRQKILQAAKELGYVGTEASPRLCFVLHGRTPDDPRYMYDLKIIEDAASKSNYSLLFVNIQAEPGDQEKLRKIIQNKEADGYIVTGDLDESAIDLIVSANVPYLFYGGIPREGTNSVVMDHRKGAYEAVKMLLEHGHRRIAFFSGNLETRIHRTNLEGYYEALEEAGIEVDKSLIQASKDEDGYEMCARLQVLDIDYTAIFCVNTVIQFGALQWLKERGIAVPSQVSLIGYGYSELAHLSKPELTTVFVSPADRQTAVARLIETIHRKKTSPEVTYLSEMKFFKGGTVSAAPKEK